MRQSAIGSINYILRMRVIGFVLLLILLTVHLSAQEMDVPMNLQYSLIGKILSFDRALKSDSNDTVVIGILYQSKFRISLNAKNELLIYAKADVNNKIGSHPVQWIGIEVNSGDEINTVLETENIAVLYVAPMRNVAIREIAQITRAKHILSLTGIPEYLEDGLAVGIGAKGDKPFIYVNLAASKAEGADFNSQFLKFVQIVESVNQ
jgi:hypothetical protein